MNVETLTKLEKLTKSETSFPSWKEFEARMLTGYVPTIKGKTKKNRELATILKNNGYNIWEGK